MAQMQNIFAIALPLHAVPWDVNTMCIVYVHILYKRLKAPPALVQVWGAGHSPKNANLL